MSVKHDYTKEEIIEIYNRNAKMIYRVCYSYLRNREDTEDAVQETFLRLLQSAERFQDNEHEKAWLIRTSINICKNVLKHWSRKNESIYDHPEIEAPSNSETDETMELIMNLPEKYKSTVYLHYYEGYSSKEIALILKKNDSTIRNYLRKARELLKTVLEE